MHLNRSAHGLVCQFLKHVELKGQLWKETGCFSMRLAEIAEASEQVS